jgi:hypothetical protein
MSAPIQAERVVAASPEAVFTFLCDFENHWKLTGPWVKAVAIEDSNGSVRIYGPLRILRRTARTKLVETEPSHALHGTAELSGGTCAHVAWDLTEDAGGTTCGCRRKSSERCSPTGCCCRSAGAGGWRAASP